MKWQNERTFLRALYLYWWRSNTVQDVTLLGNKRLLYAVLVPRRGKVNIAIGWTMNKIDTQILNIAQINSYTQLFVELSKLSKMTNFIEIEPTILIITKTL